MSEGGIEGKDCRCLVSILVNTEGDEETKQIAKERY